MSFDNQGQIGWQETISDKDGYKKLFSQETLNKIQLYLRDLFKQHIQRDIIVPFDTIGSVLSQVFQTSSPVVGDVYSRYTFPSIEENRNDCYWIINRAINIIFSEIKTEYEMINYNRSISVWNALYGDFNKEGLRAHSDIKVRNKRPDFMLFNVRY